MTAEVIGLLDRTADDFLNTDDISPSRVEAVAGIQMRGHNFALVSEVEPDERAALKVQASGMAVDILEELDTREIPLPNLDGLSAEETRAAVVTHIAERVIEGQFGQTADEANAILLAQKRELQAKLDEMIELYPEAAAMMRTITEQQETIEAYATHVATLTQQHIEKQRELEELRPSALRIAKIMYRLETSLSTATRLVRGIGSSAIIKSEVIAE